MEQQPTIDEVADQLEQLFLRIILAALVKLQDDIAGLNDEERMKF